MVVVSIAIWLAVCIIHSKFDKGDATVLLDAVEGTTMSVELIHTVIALSFMTVWAVSAQIVVRERL